MRRVWRALRNSLVVKSLGDYRRNPKLLAGVVLTVSLPVVLLSTFAIDPTTDSTLSAYLSLAQMVMNTALLYAVIRVVAGEPPSIREAYYKGSAPIVRVILTAFVLILIGLLFLLGLLIITYGVIASGTALSPSESLLIVAVALIPLIPGLYLLSRTGWSLFRLFESEDGPLQAIGASWRRTSGRGWHLLRRVIVLGLFLTLLLIIPAAILIFLQQITGWVIFSLLLQLLLPLIILPVSSIYLYRTYQGLAQ